MRLLPFERLTLRSTSPPELIEAKLATLVATPSLFGRPPEPFRGSIQGRHFKIVRVLGTFLGLPYRNSWLPVIIGDIAPVPEGTEVRVRMRLATFVGVFTAFWFGALLCFAGALLWFGVTQGFAPSAAHDGVGAGLAFTGAMGLAAYSLVSVAFWTEVKKARSALRDGLGCREVEPRNRLMRV